jgi:hypothetical protein
MFLEPTYRSPRAVTGRMLLSTIGGTGVQVQIELHAIKAWYRLVHCMGDPHGMIRRCVRKTVAFCTQIIIFLILGCTPIIPSSPPSQSTRAGYLRCDYER